jgi:hypothetical protein
VDSGERRSARLEGDHERVNFLLLLSFILTRMLIRYRLIPEERRRIRSEGDRKRPR